MINNEYDFLLLIGSDQLESLVHNQIVLKGTIQHGHVFYQIESFGGFYPLQIGKDRKLQVIYAEAATFSHISQVWVLGGLFVEEDVFLVHLRGRVDVLLRQDKMFIDLRDK